MSEQLMKKDEASGLVLLDEASQQVEAIDKLMQTGVTIAAMKEGIVKAIKVANFIQKMKAALTPEVMGAVMSLQNSALGYKTDNQKGYDLPVVQECVIEAAAMGLGITGNQFNIIAGSMYVAKNGANTMLKNLGIPHFENPGIPEVHSEKQVTYKDKFNGGEKTRVQTVWRQPVSVTWRDGEGEHTEEVSFLINVNNAMGPDAVAGKAVRKARMWLVSKITGMEIPDAEVAEAAPVDVTPEAEKPRGRFLSKQQPKPSVEVKPEPTEQQEQKTAEAPAQAEQPKADDGLDPLRKALADLRVTDVTAEDIVTAYANAGQPFNVQFCAGNAIAVVNWVRGQKAVQTVQGGQA